ncbi:hypothetical protein [Massilia aerilata]|uniref:Uncharacterized protein n=1 Tax=Massilia aerilata TaxID=453817 RepID=A0ABW0RZN2_9BURK
MAKDNSQGSGVQYKVLLKPTDVGLLVMKRMERPHLDKSAELRRLIELGYAAEQAGFILDGTILRHAGRMWETQPEFAGAGRHVAHAEVPVPVRPHPGEQPTAQGQQDEVVGSGGGGDRPEKRPEDKGATARSTLQNNLRGLSG